MLSIAAADTAYGEEDPDAIVVVVDEEEEELADDEDAPPGRSACTALMMLSNEMGAPPLTLAVRFLDAEVEAERGGSESASAGPCKAAPGAAPSSPVSPNMAAASNVEDAEENDDDDMVLLSTHFLVLLSTHFFAVSRMRLK